MIVPRAAGIIWDLLFSNDLENILLLAVVNGIHLPDNCTYFDIIIHNILPPYVITLC